MSEEWEPLPPSELDDLDRSDLEQLLEEHDVQREQEIGAAPEDLTEIDADRDEVPEDHILETTGLLSFVSSSCDCDPETLGHVFMAEWDQINDVMIPLSIASQKPGISILLRSSPTSYHLYNLSIRPFEEQIRDAAAGSGDLGHVRWAARRGYFVLRILEKWFAESGEIYKDAPEIISVFDSRSKFPQSARHLELFKQTSRDRGQDEILKELEEAAENHELIGDTLSVDHYQTLTDQAKEALEEARG